MSKPEVKVNEESGTLKVTIDKEVYKIFKHGGMAAYKTGMKLKKLSAPLKRSTQKFMSKVYGSMGADEQKQYDELAEKANSDEVSQEERELAEKEAEKLFEAHIKMEDLEAIDQAAWDSLDEDQEADLILSLFQKTFAISSEGKSLGKIENFDAHFEADKLAHIPILKAEVIKFNNFLDSQGSQN